MELGPSGEDASRSAAQEFSILWYLKVGLIPLGEVMDLQVEHSSLSV
jgi:hypothetical protein